MSIPLLTKSEADVSSNSSWSVISESEDSEIISEGNNILSCDSDSRNKNAIETEGSLFDVDEKVTHASTEDSENEDKNTEFVCFDKLSNTKQQSQASKSNKSKPVKPKNKKPKKNRRKEKAETLSLLSIVASVLTITGITFLCMLFPQNLEKEAVQNVQKTYIDVITSKNATTESFLNKTAEIYDVVNGADFFKKMKDTLSESDYFMNDETCSIDEINNEPIEDYSNSNPYRLNFVPPSTFEHSGKEKLNFDSDAESSTPYQQVQNKTLGLIKNVRRILMDPNLQIFLCTVLQDICLIKLVNQLNKQQVEKTTDNSKVYSEKISEGILKKKKITKISNLKSKQYGKITKKANKIPSLVIEKSKQTIIPPFGIITKASEQINSRRNLKLNLKGAKENGKSECERRFEELDNKWEAAGQVHRQKIQEIKENFKNEIFHIKESEKEYSLRRQRIQLLREKYIERLRSDRETYLNKLQRLREERQRIIKWLCHQKSNEVDLKDASVGNYAVLLPDTYNFQQKLLLLKSKGREPLVSLPSVPTASFPKLGAVRNSRFIKFQSIPNIPNQDIPKLDTNIKIESFNVKRDKYLEKVNKYYEKKSKYLQKKALVAEDQNKKLEYISKTAETLGEALVEDIISHMVINISEPAKKLNANSSNSIVDALKANKSNHSSVETPNLSDTSATEHQRETGIENQGLKLIVKRKLKKRDVYDLAFDGKSKKVKQDDMMKWNTERKETLHKLPQHQILTKQDPQKAFKEKIIIKGHI